MIKQKSNFPTEFDERMFVQDVDLEHIQVLTVFNNLMEKGRYTKASEYLNNSGVFFYGARIINYLEDRLAKTGQYLLNKETEGVKSALVLYQSDEPDDIENNQVWID